MATAMRDFIETDAGTRFTVDEYFKMAHAGVFGDQQTELLGGRILDMPAQGKPHRESITRTGIVLGRSFGDVSKYWLHFSGTLTLSKYDAPDPDFHVFDVPVGTPDAALPTPLLVIEVSHTTIRKDRGIKLALYAEAGVPDYWIINLDAQQVEVYRRPTRGEDGIWYYAQQTIHKRGDAIALLRRPEMTVAVDDVMAEL